MAKVKIADGSAARYVSRRAELAEQEDAADQPAWHRYVTGKHLDSEVRYVFGGPQELELFEVKMVPGTVVEPHAHHEDEIIYVVEGSLLVGAHEYGVGSALSIPALTLYGFEAGDGGLRMLNFRPRRCESRHIPKEELVGMLHAAREDRLHAG